MTIGKRFISFFVSPGKLQTHSILMILLSVLLLFVTVFIVVVFQWIDKSKDKLILKTMDETKMQFEKLLKEENDQRIHLLENINWYLSSTGEEQKIALAFQMKIALRLLEKQGFDFVQTHCIDGSICKSCNLKEEDEDMPQVVDKKFFMNLAQLKQIHYYDFFAGNYYNIYALSIANESNNVSGKSPFSGFIIAGVLIDDNELKKYEALLGSKVHLFSLEKDSNSFESEFSKYHSVIKPVFDYDNQLIGDFLICKELNIVDLFEKMIVGTIVYGIVIVLLVLLLAYFFFLKWVVRPLDIINHILSHQGNSHSVELLYSYGNEFKKIADVIEQSFEQRNELVKLKNRAEVSDRLKSSFLANMSHEIRTPLNGLIGFSDLVCQPNITQEAYNEYRNIIKSCANDLMHIVNDVLEISKIEAGGINLKLESFYVHDLLHDIESVTQLQDHSRDGVEYSVVSIGTNPEITTDYLRLKQILLNLLDNAFKFTIKGIIIVSYSCTDDSVVFKVHDTGIGISKGKQKIIFQQFRQVDEKLARKHGGNGLGLAISKNLCYLLKGKIWVESELGKGADFFVEIPLVYTDSEDETSKG